MYPPPKKITTGDILDIALYSPTLLSLHLSIMLLWLMENGSSTITFTFLGVVLGQLFPSLFSSSCLTPFLKQNLKLHSTKISMSQLTHHPALKLGSSGPLDPFLEQHKSGPSFAWSFALTGVKTLTQDPKYFPMEMNLTFPKAEMVWVQNSHGFCPSLWELWGKGILQFAYMTTNCQGDPVGNMSRRIKSKPRF